LDWKNRLPIVFWRGSPTVKSDRSFSDIGQIPRVKLCELTLANKFVDAGLIGYWGPLKWSEEEVNTYFLEKNIFRKRVNMLEHANYQYQIDIDGVANAWGFFDKLLMGSCILKVESPFKQWFYDDISAWEHFVPVKNDLSDIHEKIDWCLSNPGKSEEIARNGQQFAMSHTFEKAMALVEDEIFSNCLIPL